jgi:hypothetical protein
MSLWRLVGTSGIAPAAGSDGGSSDNGGAPGQDRVGSGAASTTVNEAVLEQCERWRAVPQLAQANNKSASVGTAEPPVLCNLPGKAEQN